MAARVSERGQPGKSQMMDADTETAAPPAPRVSERERVEGWRLHQLIEAGYPILFAERIAARVDIDLHQAVALLEHGCAPSTAAEILL